MRKLIAAILLAGSVVAAGANAAPGPNGKNKYGLCTAYFSGSETGPTNKRSAPPFKALEDAAGVDDDDTAQETEDKVEQFCSSATPGGK